MEVPPNPLPGRVVFDQSHRCTIEHSGEESWGDGKVHRSKWGSGGEGIRNCVYYYFQHTSAHFLLQGFHWFEEWTRRCWCGKGLFSEYDRVGGISKYSRLLPFSCKVWSARPWQGALEFAGKVTAKWEFLVQERRKENGGDQVIKQGDFLHILIDNKFINDQISSFALVRFLAWSHVVLNSMTRMTSWVSKKIYLVTFKYLISEWMNPFIWLNFGSGYIIWGEKVQLYVRRLEPKRSSWRNKHQTKWIGFGSSQWRRRSWSAWSSIVSPLVSPREEPKNFQN